MALTELAMTPVWRALVGMLMNWPVVLHKNMADAVDILAQEGLAAGKIEPDHFVHGVGDLLHLLDLERFALIQALPVEAGAAFGVAMVGNEENQMDGLLLALRELFPGQNIGGEHASRH